MKKTLIITMEYPPYVGGIATYVHQLASALDPQSTVVLAPVEKEQDEWDKTVSYTVIRKRLLFPFPIWPRWFRSYLHVRDIVKTHNITHIMVHHVLPMGYVAMMAKKLGITYTVFSHGTDVLAGTSTKWKRNKVEWICRKSEQIIFNSESLKRRFLRVLHEFENKSTVAYPCPDPFFAQKLTEERKHELEAKYALQGKRVILSVARMVDGKGLPHMIRLLPELLKTHPHLVWLVVGDGPKRQTLQELVAQYHVQNVVRFIGEISHKELQEYYQLAELFVLLTHPDEGKEEGLGLVFLEAAMAGLPIVAGKSGGVEEAVIHTQTGLVVDTRQEVQVREAIMQLLDNKEYAQRLAVAGKARIASEFIWSEQLKRLEPWIGSAADTEEREQHVDVTYEESH